MQAKTDTRPAAGILAVFLGFLVASLVALWVVRPGVGSDAVRGPRVGPDLHALHVSGDRVFVSGHDGAGYRDGSGAWTRIRSLDGKDAMGWATTTGALLVGGHGGLYASSDSGESFVPSRAVVEGTDVHALGAAGDIVYLSSPAKGVLVSADGGDTFEARGVMPALMGTITVSPDDPDRAVAPDMQVGAVETVDGGRTWAGLGGPAGASSVARDPLDDRNLFVVTADGAAVSNDGGATWRPRQVPDGAASATYTQTGDLVLAARRDNHAVTYQWVDDHWKSSD